MKMTRILYKLWLSIIATNVCNLSMILFNTKLRLNELLENSNRQLQSQANPKLSKKMQIHDIAADLGLNEVTQLQKIRKKNVVRVAIIGDKAYWVHNNVFYESNIVDGYIDNEGARPVDAHTLSKRELDKLLSVLDNIV
jgi:hypothetical protein